MVLFLSSRAIALTILGHFQELTSWQIDTEGKGTCDNSPKVTIQNKWLGNFEIDYHYLTLPDVTIGEVFQDVIALLLK